jgi:hypothetical protein
MEGSRNTQQGDKKFQKVFFGKPEDRSRGSHTCRFTCTFEENIKMLLYIFNVISVAQQSLVGKGLLIIEASRSHSIRHTTVGRTALDEGPARRRDLYLTTHSTHKTHTSMPPAGFEAAIPAIERPQTHALDRAATRIGFLLISCS